MERMVVFLEAEAATSMTPVFAPMIDIHCCHLFCFFGTLLFTLLSEYFYVLINQFPKKIARDIPILLQFSHTLTLTLTLIATFNVLISVRV
jgi:hypothetical protein